MLPALSFAIAKDSAGNTLSLQGRQVVWSSNNIPVADVQPSGVVTGRSIGSAQISVVVDGIGSAPIQVDIHAFFSVLPAARLEGNQQWRSSVLVASR